MNQDTICAIATAQRGVIGSIRVSGPEAIFITSRIFQPAKAGKLLSEQKPYTLTFGRIYNGEEVIDEVLVSLFRVPRSYTEEDGTEITCHDSSYILQQVVQLLIKNDCHMVQPGGYTQHALLNGKMDLSQVEAVTDLIASSPAATRRLAMGQMWGGFNKELTDLRGRLLNFAPMIELEFGFSEEDVEFAGRSALRKLADEIEQVVSRLVHSSNVGNAIKNDVPVAIIDEINTGKSTLLDILLDEDKAIVSDIHGTTRDITEDTINMGGITFRSIDTARVRETNDTIESFSIERTFQKLDQAETILWVVDPSDASSQIKQLSEKIIPRCEERQLVVVFSKADLVEKEQKEELSALLKDFPKEYTKPIFISAKERKQTDGLQEMLINATHLPMVTQGDIIVTNIRYYEVLGKALDAIHQIRDRLETHISGDFLSQNIRECIFFISDITEEVTNDMVPQNIFQYFCVGK